jgi:CpeT/CpcT family (DUF1001)
MGEAGLVRPRRRKRREGYGGFTGVTAAGAIVAAASAIALAMLPACGQHQEKPDQAQLTQLLVVLPGTYDNSAQAELDLRNSVHPAHEAVSLTITHVQASRLGRYVYYAQETAADDPRRVLSQKMYTFKFDEKHGVVETIYEVVEPLRWRDGQLNKDLFSSMMTSDVQAEGCQLFWKRKDAGFVGTHDQKVCPDPGGGPAAEFNGGALTIGDYKFRKTH